MKKQIYQNSNTIVVLVLVTVLLIGVRITHAASPQAYVSYINQKADTVEAKVYFEDPEGVFTRVQSASTMNPSGNDLNWGSNMSIKNVGDSLRYVSLTMNKYMNYFVRIADSTVTQATYVRLYPVDTTGQFGSDRDYNDYAHGNFRPDTPMCAGCHSTHSGLKEQLLKRTSYYELCMLCHSTANTQSKYDVESGRVAVAGYTTVPSLAGPFVRDTISKHNADDTAGIIPAFVPGSAPGKGLSLTCISCHNGHGGRQDNYRLLKNTIYADDGKTLGTRDIDFRAFAITADPASGEQIYMVRGNVEFCTACHLDYARGNAWVAGGVYAEDLNTGSGMARYRHPVSVGDTVYSVFGADGLKEPSFEPTPGDLLPLQYYPFEQKPGLTDKRTAVVCSTCHYAHGSTKSFYIKGQPYDGKNLLRLDNYGVCESCHKK